MAFSSWLTSQDVTRAWISTISVYLIELWRNLSAKNRKSDNTLSVSNSDFPRSFIHTSTFSQANIILRFHYKLGKKLFEHIKKISLRNTTLAWKRLKYLYQGLPGMSSFQIFSNIFLTVFSGRCLLFGGYFWGSNVKCLIGKVVHCSEK